MWLHTPQGLPAALGRRGVICQDVPRLSVAPSPGGQLSGAGGARVGPGALGSSI